MAGQKANRLGKIERGATAQADYAIATSLCIHPVRLDDRLLGRVRRCSIENDRVAGKSGDTRYQAGCDEALVGSDQRLLHAKLGEKLGQPRDFAFAKLDAGEIIDGTQDAFLGVMAYEPAFRIRSGRCRGSCFRRIRLHGQAAT